MTLAQEERDAEFSGMPHSAITMGFVDHILKVEEMPNVVKMHRSSENFTIEREFKEKTSLPDESLQKTLSIIRNKMGHDFSSSKTHIVRQLILRRMNSNNIPRIDRYQQYLKNHPEEATQLSRDLISETSTLFREPQALKGLAKALIERIQSQPVQDLTRVWVTGCSIGKEAYSITMLLHECFKKVSRPPLFKVFATDIDLQAIGEARRGLFPANIERSLGPRRVNEYFLKRSNQWLISKTVRDHLVFSVHNLLLDPPFMQLDALCCRNLCIQLEPSVQQRLLDLFYTVLKPGGLLFLGTAKTLGQEKDRHQLFKVVDKKLNIYQRHHIKEFVPIALGPSSILSNVSSSSHHNALSRPKQRGSSSPPSAQLPDYSRQIKDILLKYYVPPSVLTTIQGEIVYVHGNMSEYLNFVTGEQLRSLHILELVCPELKAPLTHALKQVKSSISIVTLDPISYQSQSETNIVNIIVRKLSHPSLLSGLILITFESQSAEEIFQSSSTASLSLQDGNRQKKLNREIRILKSSLHTTIEDLKSANDEMTATYEEIQSANEELHSMNAELESAKQESISLNQELQAVNTELQEKLDELTQAHDDLTNLINSTNIATLFIDRSMRIIRYTPHTNDIFPLIATDLGRPLKDLTSLLNMDQILDYSQEVLDTLKYQEYEDQAHNGMWYSIRITPYRTSHDRITGVVVNFSNITSTKTGQKYADHIVEAMTQPVVIVNTQFEIMTKNQAFTTTFIPSSLEDESNNLLQLFDTETHFMKSIRSKVSDVIRRPDASRTDHISVQITRFRWEALDLYCSFD